jgi:hypothetical protein
VLLYAGAGMVRVVVFCEKFRDFPSGEMAEWLKAHAWKACIGETLSRVRIPVSPPDIKNDFGFS